MGNGVRARTESSAALSMLEQLLQSGIDERLAVKSVNSILLLRSPDEMFATVDLALIDLYTAHATMLKIVGFSTSQNQEVILTLPFIPPGLEELYRKPIYEDGPFFRFSA